ncbi:hypothetical protein M501DRAFT_966299 [Patellaria atrata CBS 101060]|uniref:Cyclase n=1 Tax=Patellaria atrata CBS 101060 TaxID=1346257 RepID=A0A9P4SKA9_9PEZI|nr:hypothetical protein M501DRAFT_966299 [Patellaria atrata CBS 101060]
MVSPKLPDFDDLPPVKDLPQGCAWGIFDKDGKRDVFGTLNLLTPKVVKEAATEVKEGVSISLNWPIGAIKTPGFDRKGLVHKVLNFEDEPYNIFGFDEEVEFNTQCSTQWDSLCHFGHQGSKLNYNGIKASVQSLKQEFGSEDKEKSLPTLNHWHDRGGLVARGVLVDYKAYADANGITYDPFADSHTITVADLEKIAKQQNVTFRQGDILIVRSGFTEALEKMSAEQQTEALAKHRYCGVEGSQATARWVWNQHFAAVAGDAMAFERTPAIVNGEERGIAGLVLHPYFLSLFGLPIGELWDLKALSEYCAKKKRYTFMLTSVPLNIGGLVGSPSNALAIF